MLGTFHPRYIRGNMRLKLTCVQVTPSSGTRVIARADFAAARTLQCTAVLNMYLDSAARNVQVHFRDMPRRRDSKDLGVEVFVVHPANVQPPAAGLPGAEACPCPFSAFVAMGGRLQPVSRLRKGCSCPRKAPKPRFLACLQNCFRSDYEDFEIADQRSLPREGASHFTTQHHWILWTSSDHIMGTC